MKKIISLFFLAVFFLTISQGCNSKASDNLSDEGLMSDHKLIILLKNGYYDQLIKEELGNYTLTSVKPINKTVPQFLVELESSQSDIEAILKKLNENEGVIKAELASDSNLNEITTGKTSKKSKVAPATNR